MNQTMNNKTLILLICILVGIQFACNSVSKRIVTADKFLISQIDSASNHLLEFSSFRKIDGIEKQDGSLYYVLSYKGFLSATKDCFWNSLFYNYNLINNGHIGFSSFSISESSNGLKLGNNIGEYTLYKKGFGHNVKGVVLFEKRDSGWQIIDVEMKIDESSSK